MAPATRLAMNAGRTAGSEESNVAAASVRATGAGLLPASVTRPQAAAAVTAAVSLSVSASRPGMAAAPV